MDEELEGKEFTISHISYSNLLFNEEVLISLFYELDQHSGASVEIIRQTFIYNLMGNLLV
jgi:hypothetical protein